MAPHQDNATVMDNMMTSLIVDLKVRMEEMWNETRIYMFPLLNISIYLMSFLFFAIIVISSYFIYCLVQRKYKRKSNAFLFKITSNEYECRELAFSTANYIHAILSSLYAIYVFENDYFGNDQFKNEIFKNSKEFNFFFSYTDNITNLMSFTFGYLCVDLICYLFLVALHSKNTLNAIFHAIIVMAFSLYFVNGTGGIPALFGEISELASVTLNQQDFVENFIENFQSSVMYLIHDILNTINFVVTRGLLSVYLSYELIVNYGDLMSFILSIYDTHYSAFVIVIIQCILLIVVIVMNYIFTYDCLQFSRVAYDDYHKCHLKIIKKD